MRYPGSEPAGRGELAARDELVAPLPQRRDIGRGAADPLAAARRFSPGGPGSELHPSPGPRAIAHPALVLEARRTPLDVVAGAPPQRCEIVRVDDLLPLRQSHGEPRGLDTGELRPARLEHDAIALRVPFPERVGTTLEGEMKLLHVAAESIVRAGALEHGIQGAIQLVRRRSPPRRPARWNEQAIRVNLATRDHERMHPQEGPQQARRAAAPAVLPDTDQLPLPEEALQLLLDLDPLLSPEPLARVQVAGPTMRKAVKPSPSAASIRASRDASTSPGSSD